MPGPFRHAARVSEAGELVFADRRVWRIALLRLVGRDIDVTIRRKAKSVSLDQHGYYRAVVLPLCAEAWGWGNPAELHHELKVLHLPAVIPLEEWPGRRVGKLAQLEPPSCADLTQEQMSQFIDAVIRQAQDDGIVIPSPRTEAV